MHEFTSCGHFACKHVILLLSFLVSVDRSLGLVEEHFFFEDHHDLFNLWHHFLESWEIFTNRLGFPSELDVFRVLLLIGLLNGEDGAL